MHCLIALGSMGAVVASMIELMVLPRRMSRCLALSGVAIPKRQSCSYSGAVVLATLRSSP
jgi:hypothetical protein